jgi:hypothetical protein
MRAISPAKGPEAEGHPFERHASTVQDVAWIAPTDALGTEPGRCWMRGKEAGLSAALRFGRDDGLGIG